MEEFKSNSNKSRESKESQRQKKEKIVTGEVQVRKESAKKRFLSQMVAEDLDNVWQYIIGDVIIPSLKSAISDVVANGIDMLLYGEIRGGSSRGSRRTNSGRTSYGSYYTSNDRESRKRANTSTRYSCNEIIFSNRDEARDILEQLRMDIREYGMVTVASYYDYVGVASKFTDNKYGWEKDDLDDAKVVRYASDEYAIDLPRPNPID